MSETTILRVSGPVFLRSSLTIEVVYEVENKEEKGKTNVSPYRISIHLKENVS